MFNISYLERTLSWFLKNRIFGGIKKLKSFEYLPFAMIFVIIASINTILGILYYLNFPISLQFVQSMLILELFLSFAIIISGLLIGRIKNPWLYYIIPAVIIPLFTSSVSHPATPSKSSESSDRVGGACT